jgi:hypothetical protein
LGAAMLKSNHVRAGNANLRRAMILLAELFADEFYPRIRSRRFLRRAFVF